MRATRHGGSGADKSDDDEPGVGAVTPEPKKKTFRATEQDTTAGQQARGAYWQALQGQAPEQLIFVDETGSHIDLARLYAWAPCGQRAHATKPRNRGRTLTLLGALSSEGIVATMTVEGGTDGTVFHTYLAQVLAPRLRPGQVVIMDNLKAHKVAGVQEAIEAAHAHLLYLPPYSPELSPIELCWSKVKASLRRRAARTREALEQAWTAALSTVSASDARHWFAHCGYRTAPN